MDEECDRHLKTYQENRKYIKDHYCSRYTHLYTLKKDTSLGFHTDDSEVTLNVCLGRKFTGGTLYYKGLRCQLCQQTLALPGETFEVDHRVGRVHKILGNYNLWV